MGRHNTDILDLPKVADFLNAVDTVMNSNTFLLDAGHRLGALSGQNLERYVLSGPFHREMLHNDAKRDWHNFHEVARYGSGKTMSWVPQEGQFPVPNLKIKPTMVSFDQFRARLLWCLTEARCYYQHSGTGHLPDGQAVTMVDAFIDCLDAKQAFHGAFLEPDFLFGIDYWGYSEQDLPEGCLGYFGGPGNPNDTATVWTCSSGGYLLLTNGTP